MAVKHDEVSAALMECAHLWISVTEDIDAHRVVRLLLRLFDTYPVLTPARFNPFDPVRTPYTREAFEQLVHHEHIDRHLMLRGPGRRGELSHSLQRMTDTGTESWVYSFDMKVVPWGAIEGAADLLMELPMSLATLHAISTPERAFCKQVGAGCDHCDGFCFRMQSTHQLAFGLPTLAWRTYFGPMYIRHFGKERLLSAPAYAAKEVHPDVISIQLTESIQAIDSDWERFHATRQRVIEHLGADSFQRVRGPGDPPPMGESDRNGVPGTSIPPELIPLRRAIEKEQENERQKQQPHTEVGSLEDILAAPKRFRVVAMRVDKARIERVIVDTYREEIIRFPDALARNQVADALLAAGADFLDLAKMTEWGRRSKPLPPVDGPVPKADPRRYNTRLLAGAAGHVASTEGDIHGLQEETRMDHPVVFDKAEWHYEGNYPKDLDEEQAYVHTGLYLGWIIDTGLHNEVFAEDFAKEIADFKARRRTGPGVYQAADGIFSDDMLNREGLDFTTDYFDFNKGAYLADYEKLFATDPPSIYHVKDRWENYDRLKELLDKRLSNWRKGRVAAD